MRAQVLGNGSEICVMWAHHDGHAELRWLERIVSAGMTRGFRRRKPRPPANRRRPVRRWCRAARSGQRRSGWNRACRLPFPIRAFDPRAPDLSSKSGDGGETLWMARRKHHGQVRDRSASMRGQASSSAASSPSSVLPATRNRRPRSQNLQSTCCLGLLCRPHVEFQIPRHAHERPAGSRAR